MKTILMILTLLLSFGTFAQESAFDGETTLTLEEEQKSEEFIHQGIATTTANDLCTNGETKFKDICTNENNAFSGGFGRTLEALLPAVTKAYALIIGATNPKLTKITKKAIPEGKTPETVKLNAGQTVEGNDVVTKEQKTDYCQYIAVAGEAISVVSSQLQNTKTQENFAKAQPEARQAASFRALSTTHKDQAKASNLQAGIWGSTAGCYAALLATGFISGSVQLYAKAAGAAVIAGFYLKKASAHKKRAKILTEFASKLPGAGDCNPFTQPSCFCNEETSFSTDPSNFQKFCVAPQLVARNNNNDANICVAANGTADPSCSCSATNSCIDSVLKAGALSFGLSPTSLTNPLTALQPFSNGFGSGSLETVTGRNLANVNSILSENAPSNIGSLSDSEKDIASTVAGLGLPNAAAAILAKSKATGSLPPSFSSSGLSSGDLLASLPNKKPLLKRRASKSDYESGNSVKTKRKRSSKISAKNKRSRGRGNGSGITISDDFALKAQREAEIVKDTEANIFEVINSRYQSSAWRRFPEAITN